MKRALSLAMAVTLGACSGGGSNVMMPAPNGGAASGSGNATFKIFVPAGLTNGVRNPIAIPTPNNAMGGAQQSFGGAGVPMTGPVGNPVTPSTPGPPGSQALAIAVSGPAAINQTLTV